MVIYKLVVTAKKKKVINNRQNSYNAIMRGIEQKEKSARFINNVVILRKYKLVVGKSGLSD